MQENYVIQPEQKSVSYSVIQVVRRYRNKQTNKQVKLNIYKLQYSKQKTTESKIHTSENILRKQSTLEQLFLKVQSWKLVAISWQLGIKLRGSQVFLFFRTRSSSDAFFCFKMCNTKTGRLGWECSSGLKLLVSWVTDRHLSSENRQTNNYLKPTVVLRKQQ